MAKTRHTLFASAIMAAPLMVSSYGTTPAQAGGLSQGASRMSTTSMNRVSTQQPMTMGSMTSMGAHGSMGTPSRMGSMSMQGGSSGLNAANVSGALWQNAILLGSDSKGNMLGLNPTAKTGKMGTIIGQSGEPALPQGTVTWQDVNHAYTTAHGYSDDKVNHLRTYLGPQDIATDQQGQVMSVTPHKSLSYGLTQVQQLNSGSGMKGTVTMNGSQWGVTSSKGSNGMGQTQVSNGMGAGWTVSSGTTSTGTQCTCVYGNHGGTPYVTEITQNNTGVHINVNLLTQVNNSTTNITKVNNKTVNNTEVHNSTVNNNNISVHNHVSVQVVQQIVRESVQAVAVAGTFGGSVSGAPVFVETGYPVGGFSINGRPAVEYRAVAPVPTAVAPHIVRPHHPSAPRASHPIVAAARRAAAACTNCCVATVDAINGLRSDLVTGFAASTAATDRVAGQVGAIAGKMDGLAAAVASSHTNSNDALVSATVNGDRSIRKALAKIKTMGYVMGAVLAAIGAALLFKRCGPIGPYGNNGGNGPGPLMPPGRRKDAKGGFGGTRPDGIEPMLGTPARSEPPTAQAEAAPVVAEVQGSAAAEQDNHMVRNAVAAAAVGTLFVTGLGASYVHAAPVAANVTMQMVQSPVAPVKVATAPYVELPKETIVASTADVAPDAKATRAELASNWAAVQKELTAWKKAGDHDENAYRALNDTIVKAKDAIILAFDNGFKGEAASAAANLVARDGFKKSATARKLEIEGADELALVVGLTRLEAPTAVTGKGAGAKMARSRQFAFN